MATSINGFTFTASPNNEGTFITLVAHKDDAAGMTTLVFKLSPTEANNLYELIDSNCKIAKDRRKEVKKGDREEEKWTENEQSPSVTPAVTATTSSVPSKSVESSASTPKKKVESSIRRSGTGVAPAGARKTDTGDTHPKPPREQAGWPTPSSVDYKVTPASAKHPWVVGDLDSHRIVNSTDNWSCRVESDRASDTAAMVKKIVAVLNVHLPISTGRYTSQSYTEFADTQSGNTYSFHWEAEHPEFPSLYPLVGMLNTLEEEM